MLCEYSAVNCTPYARVETLLRIVLLALILGMQSTPAVRCTEGPQLIRPGCRLCRASRAPQKPPAELVRAVTLHVRQPTTISAVARSADGACIACPSMLMCAPGGSVRGERANFTRLVLGCIEAKFCK